MATYHLPGFIEFDLDNLDDYYDAQIDFKDHKIALDLNFDEYTIDQQKLEAVESVIKDLGLYDNKALTAIQQDYLSGNTVTDYIKHHADILNAKEKAAAANEENTVLLLSKLYLKRIGFYPENENQFAVFDYTIGEELTQYLLVVNFKRDGEIDDLTLES